MGASAEFIESRGNLAECGNILADLEVTVHVLGCLEVLKTMKNSGSPLLPLIHEVFSLLNESILLCCSGSGS